MSFSEKRGTDEAETDDDTERPRDLLCGIGPKHIRLLCDNPWEGGRGYRPSDVGDMTLDQIFFLLCDRENLRGGKKQRTKSVNFAGTPKPGKDGLVAGRDSNGNPIRLPIKGESLAARLTREARERRMAEMASDKRKKKERK